MYERSIKGVRYQLWGLNLLIIAIFTFSMVIGLGAGFLTFILALAMIMLAGVGLIIFMIGNVFLLLGSRELRNITLSVIALLMLAVAPFIFIFGIPLMPPMNFIIIHMALWLLLASPVISYIRLGGLIPGLFALVAQTGLLIYTFLIITASQANINIPLTIGITGVYFLFLEVSMIVSFLKLKRMKAGIEIVEGTARGVGETDIPIKASTISFNAPNNPERRDGAFRVMEFEFSTSTSDPDPPPKKKEPVVGKALELDKILFTMSDKAGRKKDDERYTIEDEEEIEITVEDLYLEGQDLYQILKVSPTATSNEIKKAYRKRAMLFHPDRNPGHGREYIETIGREMRKLNKAKEILLDPARRSVYDGLLRRMT